VSLRPINARPEGPTKPNLNGEGHSIDAPLRPPASVANTLGDPWSNNLHVSGWPAGIQVQYSPRSHAKTHKPRVKLNSHRLS
jgi:hypothetical protein